MTSTISVESAFAAAWADCRNPELDGTNPHFRNRFASLKATLHAVRAACAAHGLAYSQTIASTDAGTFLTSRVYSAEGGCLELSTMPLDRPSNPQAFGSNITYAKRQLAQADWGITGDDDDDAEAAARNVASPAPQPSRKPENAPNPITFDQRANIAHLAKRLGKTPQEIDAFIAWATGNAAMNLDECTEAQAEKVIDELLQRVQVIDEPEQPDLDVKTADTEEADE